MKAVGYVRQIDKLGRLVLPADIRKNLGITCGVDSVEFFLDKDSVVIKKYHPACVFCGEAENIITYKEQNICSSCLEDLKNS